MPRSTKTFDSAEPQYSNPLTASLEDSHANQPASPDASWELVTRAGSGRKCSESLPNFIHDGSLLKMFLVYCLTTTEGHSSKFAHRWKTKITKSGRLFFQLQLSEPRTAVTEPLSLLPTLRSNRWGVPDSHGKSESWKMLPTLQATDDVRGSENAEARKAKGHSLHLTDIGIHLTPRFCEWFMGFPDNWTARPESAPLETQSCPKPQSSSPVV